MEKWGLRFGKIVYKVKPEDRIKTWKILTGDIVKIISGEFQGSEGRVIGVLRKQNKVLIEGINTVAKKQDGKTFQVEQGIPAFRVALLDPQHKKPTKINWGWKEDGQGGYEHIRISKRSGIEIPKPPPIARERKTGLYDTIESVALKQTYFPSLKEYPVPRDCTW